MTAANGNSHMNGGSNDKGWFCPTCGAADITASNLAGGAAKCNVCDWSGKVEELATFVFRHDMGSPEEIFRRFFLDLRKVLARDFAERIGLWLIKWGFMEAPDNKNIKRVQLVLNRYLGVAVIAMVKAIVEERKKMEREQHGDSDSPEA